MLRRTRFFARLGARSVAPQRRAFPRRAAQRRVQCTQYVHNVFTEPTGRKCVPARANRRRTRTGIALLTVHNSSSRFLCPWHRACSASPCLPRPALKLFAYIPAWYHVYIVYISPYTRVYARISTGRTLIVMKSFSSLTVRPPVMFYCNSYYIKMELNYGNLIN